MRVLALAILALGSLPTQAAVLPFTGTLTFQVVNLGGVSVTGSGSATLNGSAGGLHLDSFTLASGAFLDAATVTVPSAAPLSGLELAGGTYTLHFANSGIINVPTGSLSNAAGSFGPGLSGGSGSGVMSLRGVALVCLFDVCSVSPSANIVVPLTPVGQGGTTYSVGGFSATAIGAPWTLGTAAVGTATAMGFAHGPASNTTSTAAPGGRISLVSPVFISLSSDSLPVLPAFTRLSIDFVPEPGTLLLLGAGVAALGVLGRRLQQH